MFPGIILPCFMTYSSSTVFCLCLIVPDILYPHLYLFPGILLLFDFILSRKVNLKVCCLLIKCLCFPVFIFRGHIKKFSKVIPNSVLDVPLGDEDWTWTFHILDCQAKLAILCSQHHEYLPAEPYQILALYFLAP